LDYDCLNALINGRNNQRFSATEAITPDSDTLCINFRKLLQESDGISIPPGLNPGIDLLSGLAITDTEIPVIIEKNGKACAVEYLGVAVNYHRDGGRSAVGHDNCWRRGILGVGEVETPAQRGILRRKLNVLYHRTTSL
jgi:hypothetical protein